MSASADRTTHAVDDGVLQHVSASQIKLYSRCARQWHFEKVLRLRHPASDAANSGKDYHAELEEYFRGGEKPTQASARQVLPFLPQPDPEFLLPEYRISTPELRCAGVRVEGYIDLLDARDALAPTIYDFKFKGSFDSVLSADELERDVQMMLYARWALEDMPAARSVRLCHVNLLSRGGAGYLLIDTVVDRNQICEFFQGTLEPAVERMVVSAGVHEPNDVAPNYAVCDKPWPCPYKNVCGLSREQIQYVNNVKVNLKGSESMQLMIDSFITKGPGAPVVDLSEEIRKRSEVVLAQLGKPGMADVRQIDFGKGTAALVASFKKDPPTGIIVASNVGLSAIVLEVLEPLADFVVRGT